MLKVALGFRVHSGWACLVVVTALDDAPQVIARRRVEMVDHRIRGSEQPYHAAKTMKLAEAEAFLGRCAATSQAVATASLQTVLQDLTARGCKLAGSCILLGSGRPAGDLAATLRSHPMIHTAEGDFFRNVLRKACESCSLPAMTVKEKELTSRAAAALRLQPEELQRSISELGKAVGPPWRQDEKLCTIAGWLALAR